MKLSLFNLIRPTQGLLASQPSSTVIGARLVTRVEPAQRTPVAGPADRKIEQRSIEPMLAVYDARVETFRIVASALRRAWRAVTASAYAGNVRVAATK